MSALSMTSEKKKIAFAVQRYGKEVSGGAEFQCRELAKNLSDLYDVEILTSCALNIYPWDNYYEEGVENLEGICVRRFKVKKKQDMAVLSSLYHDMIMDKLEYPNQYFEEYGPYCPELMDYIREHYKEYQAVIFYTYGTYISSLGLQSGLDNGIFIPTLHEDISIRSLSYKKIFEAAKAFVFNTYEEQDILHRVYDNLNKKEMVTCMGMDDIDYEKLDLSMTKPYGDYIIYAGRMTESKKCEQLFEYFIRYKKDNPSELKLLLLGTLDNTKIPEHTDIVYLGFVSQEEKLAFIRGARFLVNNSVGESLSIVLLESMLLGRPVLVNANCDVMRGQCQRSNAGLYYDNYLEFEAMTNYLLSHPKEYETMAQNGVEFVRKNYIWSEVIRNFSNLIETFRD